MIRKSSLLLAPVIFLLAIHTAAAQDRPQTLSTLFEDIFDARGALQQRVPVRIPVDERRVDEPARDGAAAVTGVGLYVQLRSGHGHLRAVDEKLRPDPRGSR